MPELPELIDELVLANHILFDQGIVDGFGHVSVRHPTASDRFLLARSVAPALVTAADIMEFDLDGNALMSAAVRFTSNGSSIAKSTASGRTPAR